MPQVSTRFPRWIVGVLGSALLLSSAACDDKDLNLVPIVRSDIVIVAGNGQTALAGQLLPNPLIVRVTDRIGNPIVDALVTWTPSAGSVSSATSRTDVNGAASVTWTLGSVVGAQTLSASVVSGASVTFTATAQ